MENQDFSNFFRIRPYYHLPTFLSDGDSADKFLRDLNFFFQLLKSSPPQGNPTQKKRKKARGTIPFRHFLKPRGQEILPELIKLMQKDAKPEDFAIMLFALQEHNLLRHDIIKINLSDLHRSLLDTFGRNVKSIGSYEALRKNIARFQKATINDELKIKAATERITQILNN